MGNIYGDLLNRDEYVKDIVSIIQNCVDHKTPTTFSIEGEWGQGKTWLINKIEAKLKNLDISREYTEEEYEKAKSDYFIIHYNAWEKDYYDEPLIAILSTIVAELNKQLIVNNILNQISKELGKEILTQLESLLGAISRRILCVDLVDVTKKSYGLFKSLKSKSQIELNAVNDKQGIDTDIEYMIKALNKLSCKTPIVFVVDELDRCVPTFAIKTLERLHHIFDKVESSVTILSISNTQLNRSIDKLYGTGSSDHYLKKFIDFRLLLNSGKADSDEVERKLNEFSRMFKAKEIDTYGEKLIDRICENLLPREIENIIDRAILCHRLVGENTSSFPQECMIAEIIIQTYWNVSVMEGNAANISPNYGNNPQTEIGTEMKEYFKQVFKDWQLPFEGDGIIAYIVELILKYQRTKIVMLTGDKLILSKKLEDYYKKYEVYFRMIKKP